MKIYTKIQLHGDQISIVRVTNHSVSATLGENLIYETANDVNAYPLTCVACECYAPVCLPPNPGTMQGLARHQINTLCPRMRDIGLIWNVLSEWLPSKNVTHFKILFCLSWTQILAQFCYSYIHRCVFTNCKIPLFV